jgi:hypothetical protein
MNEVQRVIGPTLYVTRDVTYADCVKVCENMGCVPDRITDGGFRYRGDDYKSFRIYPGRAEKAILRCNGVWAKTGRGRVLVPDKWPWIDEKLDVMDAWRSDQTVLLHGGQAIPTLLKAYGATTPISKDELCRWAVVLDAVGIRCGSLPSR